jgi:hypothetical protein
MSTAKGKVTSISKPKSVRPPSGNPGSSRRSSAPSRLKAGTARIHPVIIYPFKPAEDYSDLQALYQLVARLNGERDTYARPLTVMDCRTDAASTANPAFRKFRDGTLATHSDVLEAWCVDTCQMWYEGLGRAFQRGRPGDVYWLIPGDFDYGSAPGREVLASLHDLPEIILELDQDFCVGEIATDHNNPKQLIDTYGTFALLYNWFPKEAQELRQLTERPRSEFFAIRHEFLRDMLHQRWYAYEQTVVMLLQAVFRRKRISRFFVGHITDLPAGGESLASALQQVERTERVLKNLWRERNHARPGWIEDYRALEAHSEQVRRTAQTILQNLLS